MADFQQFYHMNLLEYLPCLEADRTSQHIERLAMLAAQLPPDSRCAVAEHPQNAWSTGDYLLRQIDYQLRLLAWALAGGEKSAPKPDPVYSPGEESAYEDMVEQAEVMASTVASVFNLDKRTEQ